MADDSNTRVANDLAKYRSMMSSHDSLTRLEFDEDSKISTSRNASEGLAVDWIYTIQNMIVARLFRRFMDGNPDLKIDRLINRHVEKTFCIDIGSQIEFISVLASEANYVIIDPSIQPPGKIFTVEPGMVFMSQEAQSLDFPDNTFLWATSLHAIEHFGLGRYGDTVDPMGDIRGVEEIHRVLQNQGVFVGSVPIVPEGEEHVSFNKNRKYSISLIKKILEDAGFQIEVEHVGLIPTNKIHRNDRPAHMCTIGEYEQYTNTIDKSLFPESVYVWLARKI